MSKPDEPDDALDEYDFSTGVRGKYAKRYAEGATTVVTVALDPDVAKHFTSPESVNEALRVYLRSKKREDGSA